jgi:hypothetical protein
LLKVTAFKKIKIYNRPDRDYYHKDIFIESGLEWEIVYLSKKDEKRKIKTILACAQLRAFDSIITMSSTACNVCFNRHNELAMRTRIASWPADARNRANGDMGASADGA